MWDSADLWATADETREELVDLYRRAWRSRDAALARGGPRGTGRGRVVAARPKRHTTFGHLVVRVVAETAQHAGHADILREGIDQQAGRDHDAQGDAAWWQAYVARIQAAADAFRPALGSTGSARQDRPAASTMTRPSSSGRVELRPVPCRHVDVVEVPDAGELLHRLLAVGDPRLELVAGVLRADRHGGHVVPPVVGEVDDVVEQAGG